MTGTYERKEFVGAAPATALSGAIGSADTSWSIDSATGWPTAATNPFVAIIDRGEATEEKVLVGARTGTALSSITRGYDDTTAQAHSAGATFEHGIDASTIDQANRLANILATTGAVFGFDGTNPVEVAGVATDNFVLLVDTAQAANLKFARLETVTDAGSAPTVSNPVRFWRDTATGLVRSSDGTTWHVIATFPVFANDAARDAYFGATPTQAGITCTVGTGATIEAQVWDGSNWIRFSNIYEGIPRFADTTARDAFFTSPTTGDTAYLTGTHQLTEYRQDEWILLNRKITNDASAPTDPHDGDIWIQPI